MTTGSKDHVMAYKEMGRNQVSDLGKTTDGHLRQLKTNNIELETRCGHVVIVVVVIFIVVVFTL